MNRQAMVGLAVLAAVFLCITAVAVIGYDDQADDGTQGPPSDESLLGHWYSIDRQGYAEDGSYVHYSEDDPSATSWDLNIYAVNDGLFNGIIGKYSISGSCFEGRVDGHLQSGGVEIWAHGLLIDADTMKLYILVNVGSGTAGTDLSFSIVAMYSHYRDADLTVGDCPIDLSGAWTRVAAHKYGINGEVAGDDPDGSLVIEAQRGIFSGVISSAEHGGADDVSTLAGACCYNQYKPRAGYLAGALFDSSGTYWNFEYEHGTLTLVSYSNDGTSAYCQAQYYTRDGSAPVIPDMAGFINGSWTCIEWDVLKGSAVTSETHEFDIQSNVIYGSMIFGQVEDNGVVMTGCGYAYGGNLTRVAFYMVTPDGEASLNTMIMMNDDQAFYTIDSGDRISKITTERVGLSGLSCEGHWYAAAAVGYDADGTYQTYLTDSPERTAFGLDVYLIEGQTFYGNYMGTEVCGSVFGTSIMFKAELNGYSDSVTCVITDSRTLEMYVLRTYEGVGGPAGSSAITGSGIWNVMLKSYFCDRGEVPVIPFVGDYLGDWTMYAGEVYDGVTLLDLGAVSGNLLHVDEIKGNLIVGTMEQIGPDGAESVDLMGVIQHYNAATDTTIGSAVDATGAVWTVRSSNGTLEFWMAGTTDGDLTPGQTAYSAFRCYSRDGSGTAPAAGTDLAGTEWKLVSQSLMTASGAHSEEVMDSSLSFTSQEDGMFHGYLTYVNKQCELGGYINSESYFTLALTYITAEGEDPQPLVVSHTKVDGYIHDGRMYVGAILLDPTTGGEVALFACFEQVPAGQGD